MKSYPNVMAIFRSKVLPPPVRKNIGDLSDREQVSIGLDLLYEDLSERDGDF